MSSRLVALVALSGFAATGCSDDAAVLVYVDGRATVPMDLVAIEEGLSARQGSYRWELVEAPEGSAGPEPEGEATATFQPDHRGTYLVERWLTYGVGEDLTHRFVVTAAGWPPSASSRVDSFSVPLQTAVVVDGTNSSSVEGIPLSYHWRLAARPAGSATTVVGTDGATTSLIPDVVGDYVIELSVFDGELWSASPALLNVVASAAVTPSLR